jgi:predicted transcriptional regulator
MEETIDFIDNSEAIDFETTFKIYRYCFELIIENIDQRLIVKILDNKNEFDERLKFILAD